MNNHKYNNKLLDRPTPEAFFSDCYKQHRQFIYTYLLNHTEDVDQAFDLTPNVFLRFWTLSNQYYKIGNARAYLMQMAKNAFRDACRKDKVRLALVQSLSDGAETSLNLTEILFDEREIQRNFQQAILDLSK